MSSNVCSHCAALEAQNARLKARLAAVIMFCNDVSRQADEVLSEHRPRGTWALWRGRKEIADRVRRVAGG